MNVDNIACYVSNLNTNETVTFNVEIPDQISDSYSAEYEDQSTRGRSSPFKSYVSSGPRSISFSVTLSLDYRRDLKSTVDCLRDMLKAAKGTVIRPPKVRVRIGDVLNIYAVPSSFECTWSGGYKDSMYRVCECSFSFDEVEDVSSYASGQAKNYIAVEERRVTENSYAADYVYGGTYNLSSKKIGYTTAAEALAGKAMNNNATSVCSPGEYYIYNKSKGMLNLTKTQGVPGSWIKV